MDRREAKKHAHRFAWRVLQNAVDRGKIGEVLERHSDADSIRIQAAYDALVQSHFERSTEAE